MDNGGKRLNDVFIYHRIYHRIRSSYCQNFYILLILCPFFLLDPEVILFFMKVECVRRYLASHLLHNGGQPPQSQTTLISAGDHSTAKLHNDPLGLTQFTAVCKGAAMGSPLGNCVEEEDAIFTLLVTNKAFYHLLHCYS